jgi:hypothetical protein
MSSEFEEIIVEMDPRDTKDFRPQGRQARFDIGTGLQGARGVADGCAGRDAGSARLLRQQRLPCSKVD